METLQERLQREAKDKCNVQLYRGSEEYFISKEGIDKIISHAIAETIKAGVSVIEGKKEQSSALDDVLDIQEVFGFNRALDTAATALKELVK